MKKIKLKVRLSLGFVNADRETVLELEVPESYTEEQIEQLKEEEAKAWMWEYLQFEYWEA